VGAAQAAATASGRAAGARVLSPEIAVRREGSRLTVRYRVERVRDGSTLVVSAGQAGASDVATARRTRLRRAGVVTLRLPPHAAGPYVVRASAFSDRGARGAMVTALVR
jgi:hypothetical protein